MSLTACSGSQINGEARAYPKRILAWHEMALDRLGAQDLTVVYCTLMTQVSTALAVVVPMLRVLTVSTAALGQEYVSRL